MRVQKASVSSAIAFRRSVFRVGESVSRSSGCIQIRHGGEMEWEVNRRRSVQKKRLIRCGVDMEDSKS